MTTWPAFAEAMYLVGKRGGWHFQNTLWDAYRDTWLQFHQPTDAEMPRLIELMAKYHDTPMDLADASLVSAAEALGLDRIFTYDSDFYIYRIGDKTAFNVIS